MTYVFVLLGVLTLLIFILIAALFNSLQKAKVQTDSAWSDIDVQLNLRYTLIPQLVNLVKEYTNKEKDILETVTRLRSEAMKTEQLGEKSNQEEKLSSTLNSILVTVENYPDIKSNNNFLKLQNQFVEIEDNIQHARRYYNGTVRIYNTKIHTIPYNFIAMAFGFRDREFFSASEEARNDVKVEM